MQWLSNVGVGSGHHGISSDNNRLPALILFIAVAGAPLPFGSRDLIVVIAWCFLLSFGLIFASFRALLPKQCALIAACIVIVLGYAAVLHEQLVETPIWANADPSWANAAVLLQRPIPGSVSIVRNEPLFALGGGLACMLSLQLGLIVGANQFRARQTVLVVAWSGVCYALYGIISFIIDPTAVLWREKTAYLSSLTATFINRNTAATYF